ncbi:MAG: cytochrome c oxidase subunit II transmembrane domain-containing protein [Pseudomonadota bacterium]
MTSLRLAAVAALSTLSVTAAKAQDAGADEASNYAHNGVAMLPAGSALASDVHFFHNAVLMPIITTISIFVLALLLWVIVRYNSKANPEPRKFSHNTLVEVIWTGVPILILLVIALFSFDLLYNEDTTPDGKQVAYQGDGATTEFEFPNDFAAASRKVAGKRHLQVFIEQGGDLRKLSDRAFKASGFKGDTVSVTLADAPSSGETVIVRGGRSLVGRGDKREIAMAPTMTLKVNGYQWGWSYAYPDFGDFEYTSNMLPEDQTTPALYRLAVDNNVVVPVGETIRVTTTARDVIHSWALPNFALKIDAVPGRINETWFKADREGIYYGQCSEICGVKHSFMPIAIEVVSREKFEAWVDGQRELAGMDPMFESDKKLAAADVGADAR